MFAAVDFLNSYEEGFSLKAPALAQLCSRRIAMWANDHRIVPRNGQFKDRNRSLYLNIAGASINEAKEVFNQPRVGI
jgi:hypothetical protein